MNQLQSLRGMIDLLPDQSRRWQAVEAIARDHFLKARIQEIRTPLLEVTELFARGIGENTDVVGKEMYTFTDRGKRSCTLRPEGTASVVRAALQKGMLAQGPQRLWYNGPMFRYERPQAGRQRQFHQIGVECLGSSSSLTDAEIIAIAWNLLENLGVKNLVLEINTLGDQTDREKYQSELVQWLKEHFNLLDADSQRRLNSNPLRILDSKILSTQEILKDAPKLLDSICAESQIRFEKVQNALKALNIPYVINSNLVRGLDYYGHTAFEIISDQLGSQSTVCGGGRYDSLVEQLGGPPTPAIGWAIGMERLMMILEAEANSDPKGKAACLSAPKEPDIYLVNRGNLAEKIALRAAIKLREAGLIVELDTSGGAFGKQFKRANRSNAHWALVIGEDEALKQEGRLKNLRKESSVDSVSSLDKIVSLDDFISIASQVRNSSLSKKPPDNNPFSGA